YTKHTRELLYHHFSSAILAAHNSSRRLTDLMVIRLDVPRQLYWRELADPSIFSTTILRYFVYYCSYAIQIAYYFTAFLCLSTEDRTRTGGSHRSGYRHCAHVVSKGRDTRRSAERRTSSAGTGL